ncbi:MAG: bifunctional pyr operon transcriptional regulator/uracil phosphoribosyltransferase PyrR [bacterium]
MNKIIKKSKDIKELIKKVSREIVSNHKHSEQLVLIGIRNRGVPLAERLSKDLEKLLKRKIEIGILDINLYRDDVHAINSQPLVKETIIPFDLNDKEVILVDDVLFSGRTIRAALDALVDLGRPKFVKLAVLIDRGNRELPIHADFVGEKINTRLDQNINVSLKEVDGVDRITIEN